MSKPTKQKKYKEDDIRKKVRDWDEIVFKTQRRRYFQNLLGGVLGSISRDYILDLMEKDFQEKSK